MSADDYFILTDVEIRAFLEAAPLYTWQHFKKPSTNRSSLHIDEVDSHCEVCDQVRPFHDLRARGGGAGMPIPTLESGTSELYFTCVSCKRSHRTYLIEHVLDGELIKLQKFGELPRGRIPRNKTLQRFLKDDGDNYEKAMVCLSNGYGIAAFVYFRRVVENNISRLLDLLHDDANASGEDPETLAAIQALRQDSPMSDRIMIANRALPHHLRPDGLNPLGRLYQVLSEGVHNLSDSECLVKARATGECLAFLVSELASRKEHRARFKSMIGRL